MFASITRGQFVCFSENCPEGWFLRNFETNKSCKSPREVLFITDFDALFTYPYYWPTYSDQQPKQQRLPVSAEKQGIWRHEPRENGEAQPTILALDIHINQHYAPSTWPTSTDDIHTIQSTSKTGTHTQSKTHDDEPPSRARWLGSGAGVWRARGV